MEKYRVLEVIGSGAYSEVFKAIQVATGKVVAIKEMQLSKQHMSINKVMLRQIKVLSSLESHPNIIKIIQCFKYKQSLCLVLQYLPMDLITFYKQLRKKQKRNLRDSQITFIFRQICLGIAFLHRKGIMHRDMKPQNVLIDPITLNVKLIDFGFAKLYQGDNNTNYMVTRWYRPLEIVLGLPYDSKVDIFSIGAILLELYNEIQVFRSSSNIDQLNWIIRICGYPYWDLAIDKINKLGISVKKTTPVLSKLTKGFRIEAQNLISSMLQTCPQNRINIFQVLSSPYFNNIQQQLCKELSPSTSSNNTIPNTPNQLANNVCDLKRGLKRNFSRQILQNSVRKESLHNKNEQYSNTRQFLKDQSFVTDHMLESNKRTYQQEKELHHQRSRKNLNRQKSHQNISRQTISQQMTRQPSLNTLNRQKSKQRFQKLLTQQTYKEQYHEPYRIKYHCPINQKQYQRDRSQQILLNSSKRQDIVANPQLGKQIYRKYKQFTSKDKYYRPHNMSAEKKYPNMTTTINLNKRADSLRTNNQPNPNYTSYKCYQYEKKDKNNQRNHSICSNNEDNTPKYQKKLIRTSLNNSTRSLRQSSQNKQQMPQSKHIKLQQIQRTGGNMFAKIKRIMNTTKSKNIENQNKTYIKYPPQPHIMLSARSNSQRNFFKF